MFLHLVCLNLPKAQQPLMIYDAHRSHSKEIYGYNANVLCQIMNFYQLQGNIRVADQRRLELVVQKEARP